MAGLPSQSEAPRQLRRPAKMDDTQQQPSNGSAATDTQKAGARSVPYTPTARETVLLTIFPALLVFGTVYSVLSPQARAARLDAMATIQSSAPTYFARKDNVLNVVFVKRGWFWITLAFGFFVGTHPSFSRAAPRHSLFSRRQSAIVRWAALTGWWILVTQWCFGPALIDRSFRLTGGGCSAPADLGHGAEVLSSLAKLTAASACKRSGGRWSGGHDISGHVFLLVSGATFLAQEVGWVLLRQTGSSGGGGGTLEDRTIVMADGAVKSAEVEAQMATPTPTPLQETDASVVGVRFAAAIIALSLWMLLMTAIYFHTWFEKLTGLLVAATGLYGVYVVPRFVPAVRWVLGMPGL